VARFYPQEGSKDEGNALTDFLIGVLDNAARQVTHESSGDAQRQITPLVFMGGSWGAVVGMGLWGVGMGAQESILRAVIATLVPAEHRGSAYGLFNAAYGIAWFLGSALMGYLYDVSLGGLIAFSVVVQLAAIPCFALVARTSAKPNFPDL
jgi:MFS family permease